MSGLSNLREIYLVENKIQNIAALGFSSLKNLELLNLSQNPELILTPLLFETLPHLQTLIMSQNNIQYTQLTSPAIFQYLINLTSIDLSRNNLTRISSDTFIGNVQLRFIDLENSNINAIQHTIFDRLTSSVVRINLKGNVCTNNAFLVLNRHFNIIRNDLRTCFNNFNGAEGLKAPKLTIIIFIAIYFNALF